MRVQSESHLVSIGQGIRHNLDDLDVSFNLWERGCSSDSCDDVPTFLDVLLDEFKSNSVYEPSNRAVHERHTLDWHR